MGMKVKDVDALREQISNDPREAFTKHQVWLLVSEHNKTVPTVEAIPKSEYEARLKADLEAILVELQLEIEEIEIDNNVPSSFEPVSKTSAFYEGVSASSKVIQEKINSLKGDQEGEE